MFVLKPDKTILITRGDIAAIDITANDSTGSPYQFKPGDIVRFKVFEKSHCDKIVLTKNVSIEQNQTTVTVSLDKTDTKIGPIINRPKDYWYEVELNPNTLPQTIIGYDENGPKIFKVFPEGADI